MSAPLKFIKQTGFEGCSEVSGGTQAGGERRKRNR